MKRGSTPWNIATMVEGNTECKRVLARAIKKDESGDASLSVPGEGALGEPAPSASSSEYESEESDRLPSAGVAHGSAHGAGLQVGISIEGNYLGRGTFYPGRIRTVNQR